MQSFNWFLCNMVTFQMNKDTTEKAFESYINETMKSLLKQQGVCYVTPLLDKRTLAQNFKFCFISFQELKEQIHFVYSCVSLPQHALNLCQGNLAQKLQIVTIVSWENILHTSPSLLVFHSFN